MKLYFYDTGIVCSLLGIENSSQISRDPIRGALFENMVIADILKTRTNKALNHNMYFFSENNKNEVDLLIKSGYKYSAFEIKSAQTFHSDFLKGLKYIKKNTGKNIFIKFDIRREERTHCRWDQNIKFF